MNRTATLERNTLETQIQISLDLDGFLEGQITTGHGFVDHMLEALKKHGRLGLSVQATGDVHVDVHHLAEDVGIAFGQAMTVALGDKRGLERYGDAFVPMDETLAHVVLDLSGRAHLAFEPEKLGIVGDVNGYTVYHLREFLRGFCNHAGANLHVRLLAGLEVHHVVEAVFKAFARALYQATRVTGEGIPSTKGTF
jgi:imidazoleglycerol-phosphate dehydratase